MNSRTNETHGFVVTPRMLRVLLLTAFAVVSVLILTAPRFAVFMSTFAQQLLR